MKNLSFESYNDVTLRGQIISKTFGNGTTKTNQPYERATIHLRVTQTFCGNTETNEIPVNFFASQYTKSGTVHPTFKAIQTLKDIPTIQEVGNAAPIVSLGGVKLQENSFVSKNGTLTTGWRLNASFINEVNKKDTACFTVELYILDKHPEIDKDGEETGRLILKGALVQYGEKLDVIEFVAEDPRVIDFIDRNWEINDTVKVQGRIRYTSVEGKSSGLKSSFGVDDEVEESNSSQTLRELIITNGQDEPYDEDFAYDPLEIKKGFNVRKANIEQLQIDAKSRTKATNNSTAKKFEWE